MIRYFLDTEFNSFGGSLISLGIARDDGECLYLVVPDSELNRIREEEGIDPWIEENVIANLHRDLYKIPGLRGICDLSNHWGKHLSDFIYREGEVPQIIVDWPSDAMDFAALLLTGPGKAVPMGNQTHITIVRHIDVYPTTLAGAVQHNAIWDALAIRQLLRELEA